jgi:hypothetical protein
MSAAKFFGFWAATKRDSLKRFVLFGFVRRASFEKGPGEMNK